MVDCKLLSTSPRQSIFIINEGGKSDGLPKVQRIDDVGTVLRFLPGLLCLEVCQLRRDHRQDDLQ